MSLFYDDIKSPLIRLLAGVPFPRHYQSVCKTILRRLFRVYAHIYYEHFDQICALGIEGEVTTLMLLQNALLMAGRLARQPT